MKTYAGMEIYIHVFLTSELDGDKLQDTYWTVSIQLHIYIHTRARA